jgi:cyanate lyase
MTGLRTLVNSLITDPEFRLIYGLENTLTVEKIKGDKGEDRLLMTWNGKFLPHIEQTA